MGHIEGLVTDAIKEQLRSGTYASPEYASASYSMPYFSQSYSFEEGGLEGTLDLFGTNLPGKQLIAYDITLNENGKVTKYMVEFATPGVNQPPTASDPQKKGIVIYDASSQEVIEINEVYDGQIRELTSSTQQHWVVPQQQLQRQIVSNMFNRPTTNRIAQYNQDPQEENRVGVDYSQASDLKNRIKQRKSELGVTPQQLEAITQQSQVQNIQYN